MIPKPTEDTVTNLLAKELEKYGVKAQTFPTISTPRGIRKPDVWCVNAGAYPVEAKFREGDLINAIAKVQNDYLRWCDVLGIKGGFAILYPEKLSRPMRSDVLMKLVYEVKFKAVAMFPPKDTRKSFTVYNGTLPEIAKILAEHVLTPPEYVEPSTNYIIKALRDSAMYITLTLKYLSGKELEDIFGGKDVFKNILQYEEEKYPVEALRLASSYLLINQLLFYHVLSRRMPDKFREIDTDRIKRPADLKDYFKDVLQVNYRTVFSYDVVSRIFSGFTDQIKAVINVIKGLGPEKIGGDLLGTIFHDLVPFEVRKNIAAFYTNVLAAELLAWLSVDRHNSKVADLAVGSGGLLVAAYRRKRHLLENERRFTAKDHRRFAEEELLGIDVMPFASNVAACHLALQSPEYFTNRVNVAIWDSTELDPGKRIPSIASLKLILKGQAGLEMFIEPKREDKGVVSLTGEIPEEIRLETYDVVIMNPPFTRQERIPKEYKAMLSDRFKDYKKYLHGQLGYFGYFILLGDRFLQNNGRMALVLPATVLRIKSCKGIRKLWAQRYHVEHIVTTWRRSAFSESVRFREILLVSKRGEPAKNAKTVVTVLKKLPKNESEARKMAELIKDSKSDWRDEKMTVKVYDYTKFRRNIKNWFKWISVSDLSLIDTANELLRSDKLTTLKDDMLRGIETSRGGKIQALTITRPERAIKKSDSWVVAEVHKRFLKTENKYTHKEMTIPSRSLRPALRRVSFVDKIDLLDMLDYVIVDEFPNSEEFFAMGVVSFSPSAGFWSRWRDYVENRMSHLSLVRRSDVSAPETHLLAFYSEDLMAPPGVAWTVKVGDREAKILSLWFNSTINVLQALLNRKETRGAFIQLDEYTLEGFRVPGIRKLSEGELKLLLETFEKVKRYEFASLLEQLEKGDEVRREIDEVWLKVLGYEGDVAKLLDKLYESLAEEIIILRKMMAEKA